MSEYRPDVTSPHTLSQRTHPCHRSLSTATYPISPRSSLGLSLFALFCLLFLRALEHSYYLNVPPTWRSSTVLIPFPLHPLCTHSISLCRIRCFFPHHPLLSLSWSFLSALSF